MENALTVTENKALAELGQQMALQLRGIAEMIRMTNERMTALERTVRMLEKVTPQQAAALNRAIRQRAAEICGDYRIEGQEKEVAAAIRKAVRLSTGARSARDIARCDFGPVSEMIRGWEEYRIIKKIKAGRGSNVVNRSDPEL